MPGALRSNVDSPMPLLAKFSKSSSVAGGMVKSVSATSSIVARAARSVSRDKEGGGGLRCCSGSFEADTKSPGTKGDRRHLRKESSRYFFPI